MLTVHHFQVEKYKNIVLSVKLIILQINVNVKSCAAYPRSTWQGEFWQRKIPSAILYQEKIRSPSPFLAWSHAEHRSLIFIVVVIKCNNKTFLMKANLSHTIIYWGRRCYKGKQKEIR